MNESERPIKPEFLDLTETSRPPQPAKLLSYLRLMRLPNVFTAIADVAMGFFVTTNSLEQWPSFLLLVVASACLYTAGMVLNDVFDIEVDRFERPSRPLPSGQISWGWARWLGFQLIVIGMVSGWLAGWVSTSALGPWWRCGLVATALAGMVFLYDGGAKRSFAGPLVMGGCRGLNVLLGMSLNAVAMAPESSWIGFGTSHVSIAAGIALYIVGVTIFARSEATESPRSSLTLGIVVMATGIAILAFFPRYHLESFVYRYEPLTTWPLALMMTSVWILRRAVVAVRDPSSRRVQDAVKNCILSLIVLDAMVCSLMAGVPFAIGIVALLIPTLILGSWVYST